MEDDVFKVRPADAEEKEWMITIGNHLATKKKFATAKEAQKYIAGKPWELISSLIFACIEAKEKQNEIENEVNNSNN